MLLHSSNKKFPVKIDQGPFNFPVARLSPKCVSNIPKDLLVKLFTGMISLFVILMAVSLFSPIEIVFVDHFVSFILGIAFAGYIYKHNFSRLARNDWLLVKLQEVS